MAAAKNTEKTAKRVIIIPRSNEGYEEAYAIANGKRIPFETPVVLSVADVKAIERQKEPYQADKKVSVFQIMEERGVSQEEANKIARGIASDPSMGAKTIKWAPKYLVKEV